MDDAPRAAVAEPEEEATGLHLLPVLPVHDIVVFPSMVIPLIVMRPPSVRALADARLRGRNLLLVAQRDPEEEEPAPDGLYQVGCIARHVQVLDLPDGTTRVVVEGLARGRILRFARTEPLFEAEVEEIIEVEDEQPETEALMRSVLGQFEQVLNLSRSIPPEVLVKAMNVRSAGKLADLAAAYLSIRVPDKQALLELSDPVARLEQLHRHLTDELEILELERRIHTRVRDEMQSSQREFYLREQLRAIQDELGDREGMTHEADEYRQKIEECGMPEEAAERAVKEVERLERMPPVAPESSVIRTYLDWLVALPWQKATQDNLDIDRAERILDEDHFGLKKIKERVVEFLAVRSLVATTKGPILCFVGPPGVGKTSIGRSIARAMGREFVRVSLGGVRDEAEVRGHRRTYVGAMPGRIIQAVRHCGFNNPVFMLDEIDKIGVDFRGDPSSALLEALDPEQNNAFSDHYLEVAFDLSRVMFIATGNVLDTVPPALRDRMEVLEFAGYVDEEKAAIARGFLIPKQLANHGLSGKSLRFQKGAISALIRSYTREAGVRELERQVAGICRKVARQVAKGSDRPVTVTPRRLEALLGPRRYLDDDADTHDEVAVATGLSYTETGGHVLNIEVSLVPGKGDLLLTGRLGEVMRESAQTALSYARAKAADLGLEPNLFEKHDIHIHVPSGGVPKEGPSAGITIAVALLSAMTQRPVRRTLAMTGEVTLRGKVLPVGGIREKVLAAHRAHLRSVIIPKENEKDLKELDEIPSNVREDMQFVFVDHMDQVLDAALV